MKGLLIALILLGTNITAFAQPSIPFPTVDGKVNFSEVVSVDGASKGDLYLGAKTWIAGNFRSSNDVVQLDDEENGVIIGKGRIVDDGKTWDFTFKFQVKDQRYKVEFYDIEYTFEQDVSNLYPSQQTMLKMIGTVTHFNIDERFSSAKPACSPGKDCRMYDRKGRIKKGFPTNFVTWTNSNFNSLLESIKDQLTKRVVVDDF